MTSTLTEAKTQVKSGVLWLGTASLVAQVLDALSLFVVLLFLSREALGVATLAWSVAVIVESFNGLGIATAILQAQKLERDELDSVFWYALLAGVFFCIVTSVVAPVFATYYGDPRLTAMIIFSAVKLPLVSAALVPLQMLSRAMRFRDVAMIQTVSSLLSVLLKMGLAVAGCGAWALVIANTAFGVATLVGAFVCYPFLPKLRFDLRRIEPHIRYGLKICPQGILYQTLRNMDFLIVGRVLGSDTLGSYRVAFDLAMTPPLAVNQTVSRTALPVFSRMLDTPKSLAETFTWMQRGLVLATLPITLFLSFGAKDLLALVGSGRWVAAAPVLIVLSWASIPRVVAQLYPELYKSVGRPGLATASMLLTFVLLVGGFFLSLFVMGTGYGALPIAWTWLLVYPLIVVVFHHVATRLVPFSPREYLLAFRHPFFAAVLATVPALLLSQGREFLPRTFWVSLVFCVLLAASILCVFWQYGQRVMGVSLKQLLGGKASRADPDATAAQ